jgi:hypothetical protein
VDSAVLSQAPPREAPDSTSGWSMCPRSSLGRRSRAFRCRRPANSRGVRGRHKGAALARLENRIGVAGRRRNLCGERTGDLAEYACSGAQRAGRVAESGWSRDLCHVAVLRHRAGGNCQDHDQGSSRQNDASKFRARRNDGKDYSKSVSPQKSVQSKNLMITSRVASLLPKELALLLFSPAECQASDLPAR